MKKVSGLSLLSSAAQRVLLTAELFGRNELANHAAAGAYGFLLSAAPALLIAAFIITNALRISPESAAALLSSFGGLGKAMDVRPLVEGFLAAPLSGFSGLLALANLFWTARVFALSLLRGIRVVYSESPRAAPVRTNLLTLALELLALLAVPAYALAARSAASGGLAFRMLPFLGLSALTYACYRTLPQAKPSRKAAAEGALSAAAAFTLVSFAFGALTDYSRYDLVYGVLGALIVALANVYFFFTCFFLGAQLAFAVDSFDALVFERFRRVKHGRKEGSGLERRLFSAPRGLLAKYSRALAAGDVLFERGDPGKEVFYVLSGSIGVYRDGARLATVEQGGFLGEMAYLLSEPRTAGARAETDSVALALPPELFERVLRADPETARHVVESLSARLKLANEKRDGGS